MRPAAGPRRARLNLSAPDVETRLVLLDASRFSAEDPRTPVGRRSVENSNLSSIFLPSEDWESASTPRVRVPALLWRKIGSQFTRQLVFQVGETWFVVR